MWESYLNRAAWISLYSRNQNNWTFLFFLSPEAVTDQELKIDLLAKEFI